MKNTDTPYQILKESEHFAPDLERIKSKVLSHQRISSEEGLLLYEKADLGFVGMLADFANLDKNGERVYFNRNLHIEPTNICIFNCAFCSYVKKKDENGWELSIEEIIKRISEQIENKITEVHIMPA